MKKKFPKKHFSSKKHTSDRSQSSENQPVVPSSNMSENESDDSTIRLNKFLAHCGIASRRAAAELIKDGNVTVNGEKILEPGHRVKPNDEVKFKGKRISVVEKKVYVLMNKPKDYITTVKDDRGRKTVMDVLDGKIKERVFPVGRLDRATTGLLLITNDGDLAKKLAHPSHEVTKIYHVVLDKPVSDAHLEKIEAGLELEDGLAPVDAVSHVKNKGKEEVGIEIHIGRNRIVRRIFEHLGYRVKRLDRVYYAGLTKKDLPRGRFRFLKEKEIIMLKHFT